MVTAALLYGCAGLQFVRFYSKNTEPYLRMGAYLSGHERMPFQMRVLPLAFLRPLSGSSWLMRHFAHTNGLFTPERGPAYLLAVIAFAVAAYFVHRLYRQVSEERTLPLAVFPVFLYTCLWTYTVHTEANFAYPYDFPSLAFFTAGLCFVYERRFWWLFAVVLAGSWNRETTLFLIALYIIDQASVEQPAGRRLSQRFDAARVPWGRVALLGVVWLAIKLFLEHRFLGNDRSEDFLRIHYNLNELRPRLVPALLNICGYTLPIVVLFRGMLRPQRYANYLWVLPLWFTVMFCAGVLVETRIYGELCGYSAVALVLILERAAKLHWATKAVEAERSEEPVTVRAEAA